MPSRRLLRLTAALGILASSFAQAESPPILDAPESAYWHEGSRSWYVSSLGGGLSVARDGVGWISRFDAEGRVVEARWVEGLDAPTGIASVGDTLFVADRGGLLEIDIRDARVLRTIELPGIAFANDVAAAADGTVYVSDMAGNRIYRVRPGQPAKVWLEGEVLQNPNGLWVDGDRLLVGTWGPMIEPGGFAVRHPGRVLSADRESGTITPLGTGEPVASIDGLVRVDDHLFATDWPGGRLLRFDAEGRHVVAASGFLQLADLGYSASTRTIALPVMGDNRLVLLHLDALERRTP